MPPPASIASRPDNAGFTLLELLVVLMVIGILLSLLTPSLDVVRGRGLADFTDRLCLTLNHARQEAALTSRPWRLEVDPAAKTLRFEYRRDVEFVSSHNPLFVEQQLPPGLDIAELSINGEPVAGPGRVYLFPTGAQDAFSLTLTEGLRRRTLSMGPVGAAEVGHR
ncbi:MAG: prepilin-type N-terminal cleavage/methylation domain-containing protein [Gammaproteobacteria bacterium]|nr:prepilin-type N-terminal cleavage/methylation domain-containing protein [Gammaproteobacteria bacterium]MCY4209985.1 prepilin-type N-terminal cleavage/methylation domain-containing protein [Gammaproteobacteria bacterium]MCY4283109.1 prepilin-type N-terminal cleavage/methylation domain-containing protein [Gammaproteobacteria bacterium]